MNVRDAIHSLEALAIHADTIAHSYDEMARHSDSLQFEKILSKIDKSTSRIFCRIAEECRNQAERLRER